MSKKAKNTEDIEDQIENGESSDSTQVDDKADKRSKAKDKSKKEKDPVELVAELKETILRIRADFDNFRKRTQRDIADARAYGKISAVEEILPIFDTFKMALQAANMDNADLNTLLAGLNMIQNQFSQSFGALGIDEINALGEAFDPNIHEAVSEEFSEDKEAGVVIGQHRCGYKVGERLIRAATVVVSKGPQVEEAQETEEALEE